MTACGRLACGGGSAASGDLGHLQVRTVPFPMTTETTRDIWAVRRHVVLGKAVEATPCRYPNDRVPPRTSSKSRQRTRRTRVPACPKAPVPAFRLGAAPGPPRVPASPVSASRLGAASGPPCAPAALALASWLGAAPGPSRVAWAPAPTFWLRAAPELPHVPRTGFAGYKQLNKYALVTQPS
jgi:hypothetical protein